MTLKAVHEKYGAVLAEDGIPLHYEDLKAEYVAITDGAILLDRSHEGRLVFSGADSFDLINRMSTNKFINPHTKAIDIAAGAGRATVFTNATGRILERVLVYRREDDALMITEPGHAGRFQGYLQKHIFFNDDVRVSSIGTQTHQLALHGEKADAVMQAFAPVAADIAPLHSFEFEFEGETIFIARRKALVGIHWLLVIPVSVADAVYEALLDVGQSYGLIPAGSLTYNTLRVRAGHPAAPELNTEYLPLEVGLWDEISFDKGCYTGQEIIARMESRQRLAKTIVQLQPEASVKAPAAVYYDGKAIGTATSSVSTPDGEHFALAIIKTDFAQLDTDFLIGGQYIPARLIALPGEQAPYLANPVS